MRVLKFTFLAAVMIIVTACASDFDKAMDSGKEALKKGEYEQAAKQFDFALIEKPNDKDALALMERTNKEIKSRISEKRKSDFLNDLDPIYERLLAFESDAELNPLQIDASTAEKKLGEAEEIKQEIKSFEQKWGYTSTIEEDMYWSLSNASDNLIYAYEDILDPSYKKVEDLPSYISERSRVLQSTPGNVAKSSFNNFKISMDIYRKHK